MLEQWCEWHLPSPNGDIRVKNMSWDSIPSKAQEELYYAAREARNESRWLRLDILTSCADRSNTRRYVQKEEDGVLRIKHTQDFYIAGFFGIKGLRACKQVCREGTAAFSGGNTFCFDTDSARHVHGRVSQDYKRCVYDQDFYNKLTLSLSGSELSDGQLPSEEKVNTYINLVFDKTATQNDSFGTFPSCVS